MGLFLKFLGVMEVLLAYGHQLLELGKLFFRDSQFSSGIKIFLIENIKMIFTIELKKYVANSSVFGVVVGKLRYKKKSWPIILLKVDKGSEVGFYCSILSLSLIKRLWVEGNK